jgi:hypothetical protein
MCRPLSSGLFGTRRLENQYFICDRAQSAQQTKNNDRRKYQMTKQGVFNSRVLSAVLLGILFMTGAVSLAAGPAVAGDWQGTLDVGGGNTLRIVVHISQDKDGKLSGAIDSLDQGASGIEITAITYKEPDLHFEVGSVGGSYDGKMNKENSQLTGEWKQGGASLALSLKRITK